MKECPQCKQRYPDDASFCYADGNTLDALDPRVGGGIGGRFAIEDVLTSGRFTTLYRAREHFSGQPHAAKIFAGGTNDNAALRGPVLKPRLRHVASQAQRLIHPNIARVYDEGEAEDGAHFVIMDLLDGQPLTKLKGQKLPVARVLVIAHQIAHALGRAHDFVIAHGDLKPANIFLHKNDQVKITDFGIARVNEGFRAPAYASPDALNLLSDYYSLGVVMFEMLTGTLPYEGADTPTLQAKHKNDPIPLASERARNIPPALDELIQSMMAKTPAGRPVDARAIIARLQPIAADLGVKLPEPDTTPPARIGGAAHGNAVQKLWEHRANVFAEMTKLGFPSGAPPHIDKILAEITGNVKSMEEIRSEAARILEVLDSIEQDSMSAMTRLGDTLTTIMFEAFKLREQFRASQGNVDPEVAEGLYALDYQVKEIHQSIESELADVKDRRAEPHKELTALSERWSNAQTDLLMASVRFCSPLRARPELSRMFEKLAKQ